MTKRRPLVAAGLAAGLTALLGLAAPPAVAGVDVGVSIGFDQPGLYGRIDIGRFPYPQVIATTPVIVVPPAYRYVRPHPVYLWVPPGHRRDWRRHCGAYGACSQPVVFVRDDWARQHVVRRDGRWADHPHRWDRGWDRGWDRDGHDRAHGDRRWDRGDDRRWDGDGRGGWDRDDRGRGRGHGRRKD